MKALLTLLLVAACGCPQKPAPASSTGASTQTTPNQGPTQGPPDPGSATEPTPSWPAGGPGIGENCGPSDSCAEGLTCVSYYGIAGPRGPQFKSCEIKCQAETDCPSGTKCVTIADGPGQVCRK